MLTPQNTWKSICGCFITYRQLSITCTSGGYKCKYFLAAECSNTTRKLITQKKLHPKQTPPKKHRVFLGVKDDIIKQTSRLLIIFANRWRCFESNYYEHNFPSLRKSRSRKATF